MTRLRASSCVLHPGWSTLILGALFLLSACNRGEKTESQPSQAASLSVSPLASISDPSAKAGAVASCLDRCTKAGEKCSAAATANGAMSQADALRCTGETDKCLKTCF